MTHTHTMHQCIQLHTWQCIHRINPRMKKKQQQHNKIYISTKSNGRRYLMQSSKRELFSEYIYLYYSTYDACYFSISILYNIENAIIVGNISDEVQFKVYIMVCFMLCSLYDALHTCVHIIVIIIISGKSKAKLHNDNLATVSGVMIEVNWCECEYP